MIIETTVIDARTFTSVAVIKRDDGTFAIQARLNAFPHGTKTAFSLREAVDSAENMATELRNIITRFNGVDLSICKNG